MISPELQLLLGCAKVDLVENRRTQFLALIAHINDWEALLRLANHHGLIPLLYLRLKETVWEYLPQEAREILEESQRNNATHALSLTSELLRLLRLLQEHQIFALPYKGPALAMQLYGDVALRQYADVDVVIRKEDWATVDALLCQNAWQPEHQLPAAQESLYQQTYKDHSYFSVRQHTLELHWGFADPHLSFPFTLEKVRSRVLASRLSGVEIAVPAAEDLLIILCFHGAKHQWERLGWIADIAQVLAIYPAIDWSLVDALAQEARCERVMSFSLEVARRLCNAPLPESVLQKIQRDPSAIALAEEIEAHIISGKKQGATIRELILFHLKMRESWLDRFLYVSRLISRTTPEDWAMLPIVLPYNLSMLYYPARVFRMFRKYLLHSAA